MANESDQARTLGQSFCSYARADSTFALRLARDLKTRGAKIWMDELDIAPGARWDRSVEEALSAWSCLLLILSPGSVASENVMDEVAYALETHKRLIPVLYLECNIPFRLRRFQYVDFRADYDLALPALLRTLGVPEYIPALANEAQVESTGPSVPVRIEDIPESQQPATSEIVENEPNGLLTDAPQTTRTLSAAIWRKPYIVGTAVLMLSAVGWYVWYVSQRPTAEPTSGIFAIRIPISCGTNEKKHFSEKLLDRIKALPGVASAAITDRLPGTAAETELLQVEGQT